MPRIKPLLVLCAALLTVTPAASADVNSDMNQFFNKLGFASNTTQPGVWQGHRTEQKVPCMGSAAVLPVPGTRSVSLVLTGGAVILSPVVLTAR